MSKSVSPRMAYLKLRGRAYYLNYPIPGELRHHYPTKSGKHQTHVVEALGTGDPEAAYRAKLPRITRIEAEFRALRRKATGPAEDETMERARMWRDSRRTAAEADDYHSMEAIDLQVSDEAELLAAKGGAAEQLAQSFVRITGGAETIKEACEDWLGRDILPARTQAKYRTAVTEFVTFMGEVPLLADMTRDNAVRYADWLNKEGRSQRTSKLVPLSPNSKRDRLMALSAFWTKWLYPRRKTTERLNPWSRLEVTQVPTASDIPWDDLGNTGRPKRREYFDEAELLAIMDAPGPDPRKAKYGKALIIEVLTLGLLTGCRPDEVCSLRLKHVRPIEGGYTLAFDDPKNDESVRTIPVLHPIAVDLLKRRIGDRKAPAEQLFPELRPKKGNDNLYELVGRAISRHLQRATGLAEGKVPYCTRHTFLTEVGNHEGINDHALKRYVGHKPPGMTDAHYRAVPMHALRTIAGKAKYPPKVEQAMAAQLGVVLPESTAEAA